MTTISFYENKKREYRAAMDAENIRHRETMKALLYEHQEAERQVQFILNQIDAEKVLSAEHILEVDGLYSNAGSDRAIALEKAIVALLDGGGILFREYVGTKNYDRWHGQYSGHPYGYGPSHGSIIFSIGLTRPVRTGQTQLTFEQIDDAVYYLRNLVRIQEAQTKAKEAVA